MPFWKRSSRSAADDFGDVLESPRVVFDVATDSVGTASNAVSDVATHVDDEVVDVATDDERLTVTFGHRYDRRTAVLRRLHTLHRAGVEVHGFAWLDPVTEPDDDWLLVQFEHWEAGRHRDPERIEPIEVARCRFGRLHGQAVIDRLLTMAGAPGLEQRRRWTIAHAAVLAAFNTHTTEAGDALVAAAARLTTADAHAAQSLLTGVRGVAELARFGIRTAMAEAPLVPLVDHRDWRVHGAATEILAALAPPRSDAATDVLVRRATELAGGSKSTEIAAEQVTLALCTASTERADADDALDALRGHVSSNVRVAATSALCRRRPERARALWQPWLVSRSQNERTAAESMVATWGDERDVPEVVRIVDHRTKPLKGTTYWPPLSAEGIAFLVRHAHIPVAEAALERIRARWDRHDDDLRRWLRLHHPDLVPQPGDG